MSKKKTTISVEKRVDLEVKAAILDSVKMIYLSHSDLTWDGCALRLDGEGAKRLDAIINFIDPTGYDWRINNRQKVAEAEYENMRKEKEEKYGNIDCEQ